MIDGKTETPDRLPAALDYSWKWFSYHAQQRLTAFNFYLVIVGVVVVGYFRCFEAGWRPIGAVVAAFGAVISLAFLFLDIRNTELVNCGRDALEKLESQFGLYIRKSDKDRTFLWEAMGPASTVFRLKEDQPVAPDSWPDFLTRHETWLRVILFLGFVAFALACLLTSLGVGFESRPLYT